MGVYRYTRAALRRRWETRSAVRDPIYVEDDQQEASFTPDYTPATPPEGASEEDPSELGSTPTTPPAEVDYTPTPPPGECAWPFTPPDEYCATPTPPPELEEEEVDYTPTTPPVVMEEEEEEEEDYTPTTPPVVLEEEEEPAVTHDGVPPTRWSESSGECSTIRCILCPTRPATHGVLCRGCWRLEKTVGIIL